MREGEANVSSSVTFAGEMSVQRGGEGGRRRRGDSWMSDQRSVYEIIAHLIISQRGEEEKGRS